MKWFFYWIGLIQLKFVCIPIFKKGLVNGGIDYGGESRQNGVLPPIFRKRDFPFPLTNYGDILAPFCTGAFTPTFSQCRTNRRTTGSIPAWKYSLLFQMRSPSFKKNIYDRLLEPYILILKSLKNTLIFCCSQPR